MNAHPNHSAPQTAHLIGHIQLLTNFRMIKIKIRAYKSLRTKNNMVFNWWVDEFQMFQMIHLCLKFSTFIDKAKLLQIWQSFIAKGITNKQPTQHSPSRNIQICSPCQKCSSGYMWNRMSLFSCVICVHFPRNGNMHLQRVLPNHVSGFLTASNNLAAFDQHKKRITQGPQ